MIGVGGIDSGAAAVAKIKAGASLIELYSALVFDGLRLVARIKSDIVECVAPGGPYRNSRIGGEQRCGDHGGELAGLVPRFRSS